MNAAVVLSIIALIAIAFSLIALSFVVAFCVREWRYERCTAPLAAAQTRSPPPPAQVAATPDHLTTATTEPVAPSPEHGKTATPYVLVVEEQAGRGSCVTIQVYGPFATNNEAEVAALRFSLKNTSTWRQVSVMRVLPPDTLAETQPTDVSAEPSIEVDQGMYNVIVPINGQRVTLACEDEAHAEELKEALKQCSWFELR